MERIKWCFKQKDGIRLSQPSAEICHSFLSRAKSSLKGAEVMRKERDPMWATVMIYYAKYYALYAFLSAIGIRCENHLCSILLAGHLLGKEKVRSIEQDRRRRLDAQYYLAVIPDTEIEAMLREAKFFVSDFEEIINALTEERIEKLRQAVRRLR